MVADDLLTTQPNVTLFAKLFFFPKRKATEKLPLNPYSDWVYTDNQFASNVTLV